MSDAPGWASVAVAAVSLGGAAVSWWRSHLSGRARREAQEARDAAQEAREVARRHMEAAQESTTHLEAIAHAVAPPRPLALSWSSRRTFVLRNTSTAPVTVTGFSRPDSLLCAPFRVPVTLAPGESVTGAAIDAHSRPFPADLWLDLDDADEPLVVPVPGRP